MGNAKPKPCATKVFLPVVQLVVKNKILIKQNHHKLHLS